MIDLTPEIKLQTTRSGGKGGQNVNKVETAVLASLHIGESQLLDAEQKEILQHKLSHRISKDGYLQVKSQAYRTQLENKEDAIKKINELIYDALKKKKARIATRPNKQSKEKRLEWKKKNAERKNHRRKFRPGEF